MYGPTLSATGLTLKAPLRSHVTGPVLTLQSTWRFSLASTFLFGFTCLQELPVVGLRSSFVASGPIPLAQLYLRCFRHRCPFGPPTLIFVLALQLTGLVSLDHVFSFVSTYMLIGFEDTSLNRGLADRSACGIHRPLLFPFGPCFSLALLVYLSHGSYVFSLAANM